MVLMTSSSARTKGRIASQLLRMLALILTCVITHSAQADNLPPLPPTNVRVHQAQLPESEFRFFSAMQVIANRCLRCHVTAGRSRDFSAYRNSEGAWVRAGLVVPSKPEESKLFRYLQGSGFSPGPYGTMPLEGNLPSDEREVIRLWIEKMNPIPIGERARSVMQTFCFACHTNRGDRWAELSDAEWATAGLIIPGNMGASKLDSRLKFGGNGLTGGTHNMPQDSALYSRFTEGDYNVIAQWVNEMLQPGELGASKPGMYLLTQKHILRTLDQNFNIQAAALNYSEPSLSIHEANRLASIQAMSDLRGYFQATEKLVSDHFGQFLSCAPSSITESCLSSTISTVGKRLFRRDLSSAEVQRYMQIALSQGASELPLGAKYALVALLNSPDFLYQKFYGQNGSLTNREVAAKLAFFLLGGNPDDGLVAAANAGRLTTSADISAQVDRLLGDSQTRAELFTDVLMESWHLNHLDETLTAGFYKAELDALKPHLLEEFRRMAAGALTAQSNGYWPEIFDFKKTFVNRTLAQHYGLSPVPVNDATWQEVALPAPRSGPLANGLLMAAHSGNKYTSTTHRGLFVINDLLCRSISAPPNLIELIQQSGLSLNDTDTVEQRINKLATTQPCAGCHQQIDPYGKVLENFDSFGRFFTTRYNAPVVTTTVIDGKTIDSPIGLAQIILAEKDRLAECFTRKVYSYATGNPINSDGVDFVAAHGLSGEQRFDFNTLINSIATHPKFRQVGAGPAATPTPSPTPPNSSGSVPRSGLALWLAADAGVTTNGSNVTQWQDQSGNSRNAAQSQATRQPVIVANRIKGHPALRFDGVDDFLSFTLPVNGRSALTLVLVSSNSADRTGGGSNAESAALFWDETAAWGTVYLSPFQSNVKMRFGTTQVGNLPSYTRPSNIGGNPTMTISVKNGTTEALYVDGNQVFSLSGKASNIAGCQDTGVVGHGVNNAFFPGEIAEILVYDRALSDTDRRSLEAYLKSKYF